MATIPMDFIVKVNPGVLAAAGNAVDLNAVLLTNAIDVPIGEVMSFASDTDIGSYFGETSTEYLYSQIVFKGPDNATITPGTMYVTQYPSTAVSAYLRGGDMSAVSLTTLQGYSGTLSVTVDGTVETSSSISLSAATSFSDAATIIQAGFTSPTFAVSWNVQHSAFVFTATSTGATSTITEATGTLSADLYLTTATGAVLSQGADAATEGTFMDGVVAVTQNWATFATTWEPLLASKQAFSDWANVNAPRYVYVGYDSDVTALTANSTTTWAYYLTSNLMDGSCPVWGDDTLAAFIQSYASSLDFNRRNGRATLAFKSQSGLVASVTNETDASNLKANGYNFYGAYGSNNPANNENFMYPGSMPGKWKWLDTYLNQVWLNANLQLAMVTLLKSVGFIPYNSVGYGLVDAACLDPINAAVNFGAIVAGVQLSSAQLAEIQQTLGIDVSGPLYSKGWYLQIQDASAAVRSARATPPMTLYYCDGGSIQQLTLASIAIQ